MFPIWDRRNVLAGPSPGQRGTKAGQDLRARGSDRDRAEAATRRLFDLKLGNQGSIKDRSSPDQLKPGESTRFPRLAIWERKAKREQVSSAVRKGINCDSVSLRGKA